MSTSSESNLGIFKRPKGILRLLQLIIAIIAFATMADVTKFDAHSQYEFQIAANVLSFVLAFIFIVCYIFADKVELFCSFFPIIEWVLDAILCLLVFLASVMTTNQCRKETDVGGGYIIIDCNDHNDKKLLQASIVFGFFDFFILLILNIIDYIEHRDGEKAEKQKASSGGGRV